MELLHLAYFVQKKLHFCTVCLMRLCLLILNREIIENDQVQVDYRRGLEDMVFNLLEQKQYTSIGYIGGLYEDGQEHIRIGGKRLQSLKDILSERGQYDPSLFHLGTISKKSGFELVYEAGRTKTLAEAVILGNDEVAEGAMEALGELKLQIPRDVAVVIYQDIQTLESKWPNSTCIEMYPTMCGKMRWKCCLAVLKTHVLSSRLRLWFRQGCGLAIQHK